MEIHFLTSLFMCPCPIITSDPHNGVVNNVNGGLTPIYLEPPISFFDIIKRVKGIKHKRGTVMIFNNALYSQCHCLIRFELILIRS